MSQMNKVLNVYAYSQGTFFKCISNGWYNSGKYTTQDQVQSLPLQLSDPLVVFKLLQTTNVKQDPSWVSSSYLLRET